MNNTLEALSSITVWSKYAKYVSELQRRETWEEIIIRYLTMMSDKFPHIENEIWSNGQLILEKKVLPSMRMLQFSGKAIEVNHARGFNCSYLPIDDYRAFSEVMFLLLGGTGVGYSVQKDDVDQLLVINKSTSSRKFVISDDIQGWADSIKVIMKWAFGKASRPVFDYTDIRPKGARLVTAGGKAPGPEPLKICHAHIFSIIDQIPNGQKLTPLNCHDILCHIANSVLAGGIRRSAMIAGFNLDDEEMLTCKYGNWWETNEQRGRANNSAIIKRSKITEDKFFELWEKVEASNSGEPGIYFTNNTKWFTNPCAEIALRPFQMCNLCEINFSSVKNQEDFEERVKVATFFGTLQASFTDFYYLREIWKKTCDKDALLGIGMTGLASHKIKEIDFKKAVETVAIEENIRVANLIGINRAARITCIKPSGTTSTVLGTSSGIHDWHSPYYLRTIRFGNNEAIVKYLLETNPHIIEPDILRPHDTYCVRIPIKAPNDAILRDDVDEIELLKRVKYIYQNWILPGHQDGDNTHNVSATISVKDNNWEKVGKWMWENKKFYNGLSVLPYYGGSYKQAPFEEITKEKYEELVSQMNFIDVKQIIEDEDVTDLKGELACAGGACEIQ